jgi:hypothetical protein
MGGPCEKGTDNEKAEADDRGDHLPARDAQNVLVENHVEDEADRDAMLKEIAETVDGQRGVGTSKIVQRSLERCAAGRFN